MQSSWIWRADSSLRTAVRRHPPVRKRQAESIQIAQPPLAEVGAVSNLRLGISAGTLRASIHDLGAVCSLAELSLPQPTAWATVADLLWAGQEPPKACTSCCAGGTERVSADRTTTPRLRREDRGIPRR